MPGPDTVLFGKKAGTGVPASDIPLLNFENPTFLKGVVMGLADLIADHEARVRDLEARLAPILWICCSCGAPNQTPRNVYPWQNTLAITLICPGCHSHQPYHYLQQFIMVE